MTVDTAEEVLTTITAITAEADLTVHSTMTAVTLERDVTAVTIDTAETALTA